MNLSRLKLAGYIPSVTRTRNPLRAICRVKTRSLRNRAKLAGMSTFLTPAGPALTAPRARPPAPATTAFAASSASTRCDTWTRTLSPPCGLSDPNQTRIHTINYELDDTERRRASNNDYQIRGTIGFIWRLIESLRIMPKATPEFDAAWRAREEMINGLLEPFCDLCDGAGLSVIARSGNTPTRIGSGISSRVCVSAPTGTSTRLDSRSMASSPMPHTMPTCGTSRRPRTGHPRAIQTTTTQPRSLAPTRKYTPAHRHPSSRSSMATTRWRRTTSPMRCASCTWSTTMRSTQQR